MNYTTYLFDFDYTLADSSRGIVTCFHNVLTRHGYTEVTDDDIKRTIGKTLEDSFFHPHRRDRCRTTGRIQGRIPKRGRYAYDCQHGAFSWKPSPY